MLIKKVLKKNRRKLAKNALMLRTRPNNQDSESCPLCGLAVFRWKVLSFCFLTKRSWQVSGNKTVFEFVSHCPCPLPLNTFQMDLGHAFMFDWYQLMNPQRSRLHRARSVSLKVPSKNFWQSFHTIFFLMSTRWNASFVTLKCSASSASTIRFPHQRVELLFYELVLCWRFKHFLNHRIAPEESCISISAT